MTEEQMWRAVVAHDLRADGRFVYGVTTTGVNCRPTCGARRPSRRHVHFFASAHAAEAAGFRPCKRCRPRDASPHGALAEALARACAMLRTSDPSIRLGELARSVGLSPSRFHRTFTAALGITPREYAETCRWNRLRTELPRSPTVARAIYDEVSGRGAASTSTPAGFSA